MIDIVEVYGMKEFDFIICDASDDTLKPISSIHTGDIHKATDLRNLLRKQTGCAELDVGIYKLEEVDNTDYRALRGYYWAMLSYIIDNEQYKRFPPERKTFFEDKECDDDILLAKLHYMVRWDTDFTDDGWDESGHLYKVVKSTAKGVCTAREMSKLFDDTRQLLIDYGADLEFFDRAYNA